MRKFVQDPADVEKRSAQAAFYGHKPQRDHTPSQRNQDEQPQAIHGSDDRPGCSQQLHVPGPARPHKVKGQVEGKTGSQAFERGQCTAARR